MPNDYFRAKNLWKNDARESAVGMLNHALEATIGAEPFWSPDWLAAGSSGAFESVVTSLLTSTFTNSARPLLRTPFGRTWAALWKLDRFDQWVHVLLAHDFFRAPEAVGFDEEEWSPPSNEERDFEAIIEALSSAARQGQLSNDPRDQPNGGLPVLTLGMIDVVEDARWGELKPRLRSALEAAYAAAPADRWTHRLETNGEDVALDFLHDLLGRYGVRNSAAEIRWQVLQRSQPAYAEAAQRALAHTTGLATSEYATQIVRFDAGREVDDGTEWLHTLMQAMRSGHFAELR